MKEDLLDSLICGGDLRHPLDRPWKRIQIGGDLAKKPSLDFHCNCNKGVELEAQGPHVKSFRYERIQMDSLIVLLRGVKSKWFVGQCQNCDTIYYAQGW